MKFKLVPVFDTSPDYNWGLIFIKKNVIKSVTVVDKIDKHDFIAPGTPGRGHWGHCPP